MGRDIATCPGMETKLLAAEERFGCRLVREDPAPAALAHLAMEEHDDLDTFVISALLAPLVVADSDHAREPLEELLRRDDVRRLLEQRLVDMAFDVGFVVPV